MACVSCFTWGRKSSISRACDIEDFRPHVKQLTQAIEDYRNVLAYLQKFAMKGEFERFLADATIFMENTGLIVIGWQWLKIAVVSKEKLESGDNNDLYHGKIHTMKYFFKYELSKTESLAKTLTHQDELTLSEFEDDKVFA